MLRKWDKLPEYMRTDEVRPYYDILARKRISLCMKRGFDIFVSASMLIILSPIFLALSIAIKIDSPGPVFFRQNRVTQYGRGFRIHKFRTMCNDAEKIGTQVTVGNDSRITKVGGKIRDYRLDEIAQLLDVLSGTMTFVGVRPEVQKYVAQYTEEMKATLLLPAGITNLTSIIYKDEGELLTNAKDADEIYVKKILPNKMKTNLKSIEEFSFFNDIKIMFMTFLAVLGKDYSKNNE